MTDAQFKILVQLLEDMKSSLDSIELHAGNITFVEDGVKETAELLKKMR